MTKIKIITKKCNNEIPVIKINDNYLSLKYNKKDFFEGEVDVDDTFKINISLVHELEAKNWKLIYFFHYLISLFGFFNYKYGKKMVPKLNYEANLPVPEKGEMSIAYYMFRPNKPALEIKGVGDSYNNETNVYGRKTKIEKRIKRLKWFKFLGFIMLITLIFLGTKMIIG